jgi:outer membrane protein OmpA-like peptidoglycan-associated protein
LNQREVVAAPKYSTAQASVILQRRCGGCKKKMAKGLLQRRVVREDPVVDVPAIVHEVLLTPGRPLDVETRSLMESGFSHELSRVQSQAAPQAALIVGSANNSNEQEADKIAESVMQSTPLQRASAKPQCDFSHVRVHDDAKAAKSARMMNALAYTVGQNIVFGSEQYSTNTKEGQMLLAHELTHTIQQNSSDSHLRRKCGVESIGPLSPDCEEIIDKSARPSGNKLGKDRFLFKKNCDEFADDYEKKLFDVASEIPPNAKIKILGMASKDGPVDFNKSLSCERARRGAEVITRSGRGSQIESTKATGPIGVEGDANLRAVDIQEKGSSGTGPIPPSPKETISSQTVATAPPKRWRTEIGVGEEVKLTHSPGSADWRISGPGWLSAVRPDQTCNQKQCNGDTVKLTALDVKGDIFVKAGAATIDFKVIAPASVFMERVATVHYIGHPDIGILTAAYLRPDTVNFHKVTYHELNIPGAGTGVYSYNPFRNGHCREAVSVGAPCRDYSLTEIVVSGKGTLGGLTKSGVLGDCAYSGDPVVDNNAVAPFAPGMAHLYIPYHYKIGKGPFRWFNDVHQLHILESDASTLTASKAGAAGKITVASDTLKRYGCG